MKNKQADLENLIKIFEDQTIPIEEWNHERHLEVALWYVRLFDVEEAIKRMRRGIQKYNEVKKIPLTQTSGYHDTITVFWIYRLKYFLKYECTSENLLTQIEEMKSRFADKRFLLKYYSRDLIMSWDARKSWQEPDLEPLPSIL